MLSADFLLQSKGKRKYRRNNHIPSPEVAALIGQANLAYIQSQFAEAIPILLEVIRIDPKIHSAWQTMAVCHQELGNTEQSLQCNLLAAHLDGDAQTWKDLAQRSA
jgi:general transcription factor 3C polypeptide 3 (transcription factor C subunit 4)